MKKFGIDTTKITPMITSDGASNTGAFIRLVGGVQQKCLSHCLHLVVTEILYNKKSRVFNQAVEDIATSNSQAHKGE